VAKARAQSGAFLVDVRKRECEHFTLQLAKRASCAAMASTLLPAGGKMGHAHPPHPSHRELSVLTIEIATCLRDAAGAGATQPSAGEPVSRRMRALLPQLLGTCVEAAGTVAGELERRGGRAHVRVCERLPRR